MAKKVISTIVTEIRQAKYFSISIDSTPDISHVDQLSFIVRYVSKEGCPIERFIRFIPNCSHKAKDMATIVLQTLKNYDLDIANCRRQSYDNASNMSGAYSGLQARIKEVNSLAVFVPCSAHSLNLVGSCAAESCEAAISFFSNLQTLYNFFSISTHRWGVLVSKLKPNSTVLKSLSQTRWSAQGDACKSLCISWTEIMEALKIIANDMSEKPSTRFEASGLLNCFGSLEMCFLTLMWNDVLERFNKVSKSLQSVDIGLGTVVELYHSLVMYLEGIREDGIFDLYESRGIELSGEQNYTYDLKRKPKRKVQFDEVKRNDTELSGRNRFRVTTYKVIIDRLITELQRRGTAYEKLNNKFDFLTKLNILNTQEVCEGAFNLKDFYPGDSDENIKNECLHLQAHLLSTEATKEKKMSSLELYKFILENGFIDIYPNIGISLRMLLSTPVSNCSAERSFSALKRIKNYLRSNTEEKRLTSLAVLYIGSEVMQGVDYSEVIRSFAEQKARRGEIIEIESSLNHVVVWYFRKNVDNVANYRAFLTSIESELIAKLCECTRIHPIKYNIKLEATYVVPNVANSAQNRAFKTSAKELYAHSNVASSVDRNFTRLQEVDFCKPIYIGFAVLELSKVLMYGFHYDVMKRHYRDRIELLYTDTDSLFYRVETKDFYDDLAANPNLMRFMDTSNLPSDHKCYSAVRKRIPGLFKNETDSRTVYEFVALRAKSYAYDVEQNVCIRAKGVMGHVIRNHLTFAEHKRCLFADVDDGVESDECDDEFDVNMGKMIAADSALKSRRSNT
ncbi:hypothetical protein QTP88_000821 [Uroleucon formosanum]